MTVGVILAYFVSEAILRRLTYETTTDSTSFRVSGHVDKLPSFIRSSVDHYVRENQLRHAVASAAAPDVKLKAMYALAGYYDGQERLAVFRDITHTFPATPDAARAWAAVIVELEPTTALTHYLEFIDNCDYQSRREKTVVYVTGWSVIQSFSADHQLRYLAAMADDDITDLYLVDAYERLRTLSSHADDARLNAKARKLVQRCREIAGGRKSADRERR